MSGTTTKTIKVYTPRIWTRQVHESKKRWIVIVAHRRSGKTTASINHLIRDATKIPKSRWAYISPTYKQSKDVAWDMLKEYAGKFAGVKFNEGELRVDFANGSRLRLYGADNPDSLRGLGLWGVIFDEYSQQPSNIFTEIIRPALADHRGYAIWIGTPKGKNDFYRLYLRAKEQDKWLGIKLDVDDTGLIAKEELEDAREIMDEDEFQQEWYCSFEASIKGAYYGEQLNEARSEGRIGGAVPYNRGVKVDTSWDIGVGDATAIWFIQRIGHEIHLIDYYESVGQGFPYYAKVLQDKGYIYGKHYAPFDIENQEFGTGKTRKEIATKLGIYFTVVPKLPIEEGIDSVRRMFNKCWFDKEKTMLGINALGSYHKEWDDKRGEFKNQPFHDWSSHAADSFRYLALGRVEGEIGSYVEDPELEEFREIRAKKEEKGADVIDIFE